MSLKDNAKAFFQENREALQELIKEQTKKHFDECKVWLKKQYEQDKEVLVALLEEKILSKRIKKSKVECCDAVETEPTDVEPLE